MGKEKAYHYLSIIKLEIPKTLYVKVSRELSILALILRNLCHRLPYILNL